MDLRQYMPQTLVAQGPQGLLGGGMAGIAAKAMQDRPYQLHVQEAKSLGQQPLPYEQWVQMQQQPKPMGLLSQ
jgi:hypothetical protein